MSSLCESNLFLFHPLPPSLLLSRLASLEWHSEYSSPPVIYVINSSGKKLFHSTFLSSEYPFGINFVLVFLLRKEERENFFLVSKIWSVFAVLLSFFETISPSCISGGFLGEESYFDLPLIGSEERKKSFLLLQRGRDISGERKVCLMCILCGFILFFFKLITIWCVQHVSCSVGYKNIRVTTPVPHNADVADWTGRDEGMEGKNGEGIGRRDMEILLLLFLLEWIPRLMILLLL